MYSKTCDVLKMNEAMQIIFSQGSRNIENTEAVLIDHIVYKKSAAYQAGHCWAQSTLKDTISCLYFCKLGGGSWSMSRGGPRGHLTRGCSVMSCVVVAERAELFSYKPWKPNEVFQFKIITKVLVI